MAVPSALLQDADVSHGRNSGQEEKESQRVWILQSRQSFQKRVVNVGRKNRRKLQSSVTPIRELRNKFCHKPKHFDGRCSYCGRYIYPGTWHWMYDEWCQRVKKCNDEWHCSRKRDWKQEASFRKAMRLWNS